MHLEGSLEPQLMLDLATRNGVKLRWNTARELRAAYDFTNLQSFLDLLYEGCRVLVDDEAVRDSRLGLCDLTARVLELGLSLLGIEAPEQM